VHPHTIADFLGIGNFTIADNAIVNEADLGVNFFLDEDCLGKSRSESCVKLLQELNPDVKGAWFPKQKVLSEAAD
jgi:amyloid beta precursor protein binding protein 1